VRGFIIPFDELQIIQRIGGGAGGIVMKAVWCVAKSHSLIVVLLLRVLTCQWKHHTRNDMIVAVKQLNQLLQEGRDLVDFLNEIEIMRYVLLPTRLSALTSSAAGVYSKRHSCV
jgi:hypothetical protein